jgi:hypothetical protein
VECKQEVESEGDCIELYTYDEDDYIEIEQLDGEPYNIIVDLLPHELEHNMPVLWLVSNPLDGALHTLGSGSRDGYIVDIDGNEVEWSRAWSISVSGFEHITTEGIHTVTATSHDWGEIKFITQIEVMVVYDTFWLDVPDVTVAQGSASTHGGTRPIWFNLRNSTGVVGG